VTPYDSARVQAFVAEVGDDVLQFLTLVAYSGTALAPAACHRLHLRFFTTLSDWERCEAVFRLRFAAEEKLRRMCEGFTAAAREADDRADEEVF